MSQFEYRFQFQFADSFLKDNCMAGMDDRIQPTLPLVWLPLLNIIYFILNHFYFTVLVDVAQTEWLMDFSALQMHYSS